MERQPKTPVRELLAIGLIGLAAWAGLRSLGWDLRVSPLVWVVDDFKYAVQAVHMLDGEWLGPYDSVHLPLTKRPLTSAVLAVMSVLYLPYTATMQCLQILALVIVGWGLRRCGWSWWAVGPLIIIGALLPQHYGEKSTRLLRDPLFTVTQLSIVGIAISLVARGAGGSATEVFRLKRWWLFLGLLMLHWGMREEAFLLYPGLVVLGMAFCTRESRVGAWARVAVLGLMMAMASLAVHAMWASLAAMNQWYYGVALVDEHSEGNWPLAMGALHSIEETPGFSRLLIDKSEREKLKQLSPTFARLAFVFDFYPHCQDEHMDFSHQLWYMHLEDVRQHREKENMSAQSSQALYAKLRDEIIAAADAGKLNCRKVRERSLRPPLRPEYLPFLRQALYEVVWTQFLHLGPCAFTSRLFEIGKDELSGYNHWVFSHIVREDMYGRVGDQVAGTPPAPLAVLDRQVAKRRFVAGIYEGLAPWVIAAATLLFVVRSTLLRRWGPNLAWWIAVAAATIWAARLAAIVFISTFDNVMEPHYLFPCYPFVLLFVMAVCVDYGVHARGICGTRRVLGASGREAR